MVSTVTFGLVTRGSFITAVSLCFVAGTPVAQIIATDADKDENATLVYDFKKGKS